LKALKMMKELNKEELEMVNSGFVAAAAGAAAVGSAALLTPTP
jgi:hypothetical protein